MRENEDRPRRWVEKKINQTNFTTFLKLQLVLIYGHTNESYTQFYVDSGHSGTN